MYPCVFTVIKHHEHNNLWTREFILELEMSDPGLGTQVTSNSIFQCGNRFDEAFTVFTR